jgi:tetratricopeptide (TPR) repeat protein/TolB-like protein
VLNALDRLLAWPEMMRSPQLGKFLSYIVQRTLDGEGQAIKAYSIAVDVFGRPADFDPQSDPIVRVQARRLRALLNSYYDANADSEPVQIRLPTGRYIPDFVVIRDAIEAPPPAPSSKTKSQDWRWLLLVLACLLVLAIAYWLTQRARVDQLQGTEFNAPSVTVLEFVAPPPGGEGAPMVSGLAIEMVTDLEQFENIAVRYGGTTLASDPDGHSTDFVLTGAVEPEGENMRYTANLSAGESTDPVWSQTISVSQEEAHQPAVLDQLSRSFSMVLGSPRGPLHASARSRAVAGASTPPEVSVYFCRVLFDLYRERATDADAQRAEDCLSRLSPEERANPTAHAMGASLAVETIDAALDSDSRAEINSRALGDLDLALEATPVSSFVWEQRARLQETWGDRAMASTNYSSALQLNPANTDAMAAFGRLLALQGATQEARSLVYDALAAPKPPSWYHGGPAILALLDQDYPGAVEFAQRYAAVDPELGPVLALMAGHHAGRAELVEQYRPEVMAHPAFRQSGILPRLRETISNQALLEMIRTTLPAAGVPPAALEQPF